MPTSIPFQLKLPLSFDPFPLQRDVEGLDSADWTDHFNKRDYEGHWAGVPLIGPAGETHPIRQLHSDPGCTEWAATEILGRCPALAQLLGALQCELHSARLLRLGAGARIIEHTDHCLAFEDGEVRLHVPITTGPEVEFTLAGRRVEMACGELWYLNVNQPHHVWNRGPQARTHLVVDCAVNDWLLGMARGAQGTREPVQAS